METKRIDKIDKHSTADMQEELALLQALKMRDKISRDELEQAGRTLKDSPVTPTPERWIPSARTSPLSYSRSKPI